MGFRTWEYRLKYFSCELVIEQLLINFPSSIVFRGTILILLQTHVIIKNYILIFFNVHTLGFFPFFLNRWTNSLIVKLSVHIGYTTKAIKPISYLCLTFLIALLMFIYTNIHYIGFFSRTCSRLNATMQFLFCYYTCLFSTSFVTLHISVVNNVQSINKKYSYNLDMRPNKRTNP